MLPSHRVSNRFQSKRHFIDILPKFKVKSSSLTCSYPSPGAASGRRVWGVPQGWGASPSCLSPRLWGVLPAPSLPVCSQPLLSRGDIARVCLCLSVCLSRASADSPVLTSLPASREPRSGVAPAAPRQTTARRLYLQPGPVPPGLLSALHLRVSSSPGDSSIPSCGWRARAFSCGLRTISARPRSRACCRPRVTGQHGA